MHDDYKITSNPSCGFSTSWHADCSGVQLVSGPAGLTLWCPQCRVASDLEAVSNKVDLADCCMPRKLVKGG